MSKPDTALAARREAAAKVAIAKVLSERKLPAEASLADIEQAALAAGAEIQQVLAAELAQESATALPPWPDCPTCGQKLKTKGKRRRRTPAHTAGAGRDGSGRNRDRTALLPL